MKKAFFQKIIEQKTATLLKVLGRTTCGNANIAIAGSMDLECRCISYWKKDGEATQTSANQERICKTTHVTLPLYQLSVISIQWVVQEVLLN